MKYTTVKDIKILPHIEQSGILRGGNSMISDVRSGEIWEVESFSGESREYLILKCFDDYATGLLLTFTEPKQNGLQIRSRSMMWTDCARLGYVYYDKCISMVRTVSADEMNRVITEIVKATGLYPKTEKPEELKIVEPVKVVDEPVVSPDSTDLMELKIAFEGEKREKEVYKNLCEVLLSRLVS